MHLDHSRLVAGRTGRLLVRVLLDDAAEPNDAAAAGAAPADAAPADAAGLDVTGFVLEGADPRLVAASAASST